MNFSVVSQVDSLQQAWRIAPITIAVGFADGLSENFQRIILLVFRSRFAFGDRHRVDFVTHRNGCAIRSRRQSDRIVNDFGWQAAWNVTGEVYTCLLYTSDAADE